MVACIDHVNTRLFCWFSYLLMVVFAFHVGVMGMGVALLCCKPHLGSSLFVSFILGSMTRRYGLTGGTQKGYLYKGHQGWGKVFLFL